MAKVMAVLSSGYVDEENDYVTGWWAEELFEPILALQEEGHIVGLASPEGGKPVVDPISLSDEYDPEGKYKKLYDSGIADKTTPIVDVKASDYDAIFIVGGHGAMFDLAHNKDLHAIINIVFEHGGIVSAVCHGPAPLIYTKNKDGRNILEGLNVTGYPNDQEPKEVQGLLPFSLEDELRRIANYSDGSGEKEHIVWGSDQILTGRDPHSSTLFGRELAKKLTQREQEKEDAFFSNP
ncbi:type 1 glutamine amidotransferase domain-containing protein [Planococcus sp. N028]|uniref:Type 1 glutamine amidotransferase domain-containing protein n=1 Tax=Planococcus shixiaomingii TaxID=3058393 RepID=A0ABT8N294_9BACL|nr:MULTISPECIES: type 1 glutamine amidotransferase domain-containing protein [unclassified Planococcus (in: firmicutes)]MDN7242007.1 type 1 glutamine amidotransferase domain-containing protein [Planococcus sp. N028]WKA54287.1 type 1 glutamine amidotransferase domain-containing protein [Planococcus sp. N022]